LFILVLLFVNFFLFTLVIDITLRQPFSVDGNISYHLSRIGSLVSYRVGLCRYYYTIRYQGR